jgi:thiamine-monophosphate kinase
VAPWSERALIEKIRTASKGNDPGLLHSIGDDCCEVVAPGSFLLSTDSLVDGVHFDRSFHTAHLLGRKSIAVNLSDIAAMGGTPRFVLLSLCLPVDLEWQWISSWLDGALEMLSQHNCILIGGDTVKARELVFGITILGEPPANGALYRSTAMVGDSVWVSGPLGAAGAGLQLLQQKKDKCPSSADNMDSGQWHALFKAHLDPSPRVALGTELAGCGMVTAMQDISDGLATDLAHICDASAVSAVIQSSLLPHLPELEAAAQILGTDSVNLMLRSGEDYELIFTVRKGAEAAFRDTFGSSHGELFCIGEIGAGTGVVLQSHGREEDISYQGFEH